MADVIKLAKELADEFRGRAAQYDQTGEFPAENYQRMRETGYLAAPVPVELGGSGADIVTMSRAQEELARGCPSTALAVNMHEFQVGTMAEGHRAGNAAFEPILRRIAHEGIVIGSNGAESMVVGPWTTATTAEPKNGGYVINGRKFFCSQASGMDVLRFIARDTETDELLIVATGAKTEGLKVVETWDTTGMRATTSHDIVFENMMVPAAAVGARLAAGEPLRMAPVANIGRWFLPLVSGVYLGIAEEARAEAYKALGTGINSANRDQALTDVLIGEMEASLITARAVRDAIAAELNDPPKDPGTMLAKAVLCKEIVVSNAIATVEKAVEIAGGRSFYRKSPLERLARDVRAGKFHPPSAPMSFQIAGQRGREAMTQAAVAAH